MGNLINPVSQRLGFTKYWVSSWSTTAPNTNYSYLIGSDVMLSSYMRVVWKILNSRLNKKKSDFFISWKILNVFDKTFLLLYCQASNLLKLQRTIKKVVPYLIKKSYLAGTIKRPVAFPPKAGCSEHITASHVNNGVRYPKKLVPTAKLMAPSKVSKVVLATTKHNPKIIHTQAVDRLVRGASLLSKILRTTNVMPLPSPGPIRSKKRKIIAKSIFRYIFYVIHFPMITRFLKLALSKVIKPDSHLLPVYIIVSKTGVTSELLTQYIVSRLKNNFPIRKLVKSIIKQLKFFNIKSSIVGFKIVCSGRFERRGRASYVWDSLGKVPNTNQQIKLDYAIKLVTLTNSLCAVKIWLAYNKQAKKIIMS